MRPEGRAARIILGPANRGSNELAVKSIVLKLDFENARSRLSDKGLGVAFSLAFPNCRLVGVLAGEGAAR